MCAISVCNTLTVGVNLSSTPSTSGPGSATDQNLIYVIHYVIDFYKPLLRKSKNRFSGK